MLSKFSNSPDELSENDELREFELSGSDSIYAMLRMIILISIQCWSFGKDNKKRSGAVYV